MHIVIYKTGNFAEHVPSRQALHESPEIVRSKLIAYLLLTPHSNSAVNRLPPFYSHDTWNCAY